MIQGIKHLMDHLDKMKGVKPIFILVWIILSVYCSFITIQYTLTMVAQPAYDHSMRLLSGSEKQRTYPNNSR
jgi:hypothetical protein